MTIPIAKICHKKIAIVLVGLLVFADIFPTVFVQAETNSKEIYYADQDYITVKADQRQWEYLLSIDSKNLGALDWVGYVFRLKPEEFKSLEDFQQKVKNNRIVYLDEGETIGMVYATAKSVFRYLDVLSTVIDFAAKKIFGTAIIDTVNLPANESSIYLIRAYSGSWGKLNDSGEKSFVREKLTGGKARDDQALALNLFTIVLDVASLIIPFDKTLTPDDLQKIATAGLIEVSHKFGQPDFMQGGANGKDLYQLAVGGAAAMFKEFFNLLKDEASKKFIKLAIRNSQLAVNLVNLSDKVSKGGKIADRIFQLLTLATPLETSYLTVNNALAKLAKEKVAQSIEEIPNWELISGDPKDSCTTPIYEGEAEIKGWYFYNNEEGYVQNMWLFEVAREDIKKLPKGFNEMVTVPVHLKVEDITTTEEEALKNTSKEKPKSIVIRAFSYYCEGPPWVSSKKPTDSWKLIRDDKIGISFKVPDYFTKAEQQELKERENSSAFGELSIFLGDGAVFVSISDDLPVSSSDDLKRVLKNSDKIEKKEVHSGSKKGIQYTVYFSDNSGANGQTIVRIFPINNMFVSIFCSFDTFFIGQTNPICERIFNTVSL